MSSYFGYRKIYEIHGCPEFHFAFETGMFQTNRIRYKLKYPFSKKQKIAQNMLSNERKKLLSILSSTIKSLSDLKPDLSDLEIEIVKEILDYRNIEYEDM